MKPLFIEAAPAAWPTIAGATPDDTALLIIDMQRDFCDPQGYVAAMGYDIAPIRRIIPNIAAVRRAFHAWGGLVIQTREGHRPDLSDLSPLKLQRSRRGGAEIGSRGPLGRLLIRGETGWDIVPELTPSANEILIDKPGYSAFHATDLEQILGVRGIRKLVIAGVTTDVCVHSTLRSAVDRGYECLLLEDCCAATVATNHASAMNTVETEGGIFGAVTNAEAFCRALHQSQEDRDPERTPGMNAVA